MRSTDHYYFILSCLQAPQDQELQAALQSWLEADSTHRTLYSQVKGLWEQSPEAAWFEDADSEAATQRFLQLLPPASVVPMRSKWWKVAAAAAILIAATAGAWYWQHEPATTWLSKTTGQQPDSLLLSDGSIVYLNKNTRIKYPAAFDGKLRQVELQAGEAFFNVITYPTIPFTVASGPVQVRVLGTSFNLKKGDDAIRVFVLSGKVALGKGEVSLPLEAGKGGVFYPGRNVISNDSEADVNQLSWRTRELHFEDTSIQEVCATLSDYYHVEIIIDKNLSASKKLNANFRDKNLEEVLRTLSALYDYHFEHRGDTIYVH